MVDVGGIGLGLKLHGLVAGLNQTPNQGGRNLQGRDTLRLTRVVAQGEPPSRGQGLSRGIDAEFQVIFREGKRPTIDYGKATAAAGEESSHDEAGESHSPPALEDGR